MQPRRSRQAVASAAHSCLCRSAIALAAVSALLPATRRAGLREAWSSSARPAVATTFAPAPAVSVCAREGRLPATVPCGTPSALVCGGKEHSCEPVNGALVEDELIAEAMWPGLNLASGSASEEVVDPGRGRHLIGMWLRGSRTRARSSGDLGFECADRPAARSCAPGELAAAGLVGLGKQDLSVALGERAVVDQLNRIIGEVEQTDGVREVAPAAAEPACEARRGDVQFVEQRGDRAGLLDHAEVLASDVLDQCQLDRPRPVDWPRDERRDRQASSELGGAPAPLARDQLVPAGRSGLDDDRLHTPRSRIESARAASDASSRCLRGWAGFGWMACSAMSRRGPLALSDASARAMWHLSPATGSSIRSVRL